jgi:hypothetical protein
MFDREENYTQVRITAFDGLFMAIMNYVLAVIAHNLSRIVRRFSAHCACLSLALLVQMGEMKLNSKDPKSLIEEDGSIPGKNKELRKSKMDTMIKALRKDKADTQELRSIQRLLVYKINAHKVAVLRVEFTPESGITAHVVGEEAGQRLMNTFDSDGVWLPFESILMVLQGRWWLA